MLSGVAGKNHAGVSLTSETQQFEHLASAKLPRFVHNNDRAGDKFTPDQKTGDR